MNWGTEKVPAGRGKVCMENSLRCCSISEKSEKTHRCRIRVFCDGNINRNMRDECVEFITWLKWEYSFPVRVLICLKNEKAFSENGKKICARFREPDHKNEDPIIEVFMGEYENIRKEADYNHAMPELFSWIVRELLYCFLWNGCRKKRADKDKDFFHEKQVGYYEKKIVSNYMQLYNIRKMGPLWIWENHQKKIPKDCKTGICIYFEKNTDQNIKRETICFISWLKTQYKFPVKVYIWLKKDGSLYLKNGSEAYGFFRGVVSIVLCKHNRFFAKH